MFAFLAEMEKKIRGLKYQKGDNTCLLMPNFLFSIPPASCLKILENIHPWKIDELPRNPIFVSDLVLLPVLQLVIHNIRFL